MGTVINLKQAKRKLAKLKKENQASENRAKFGQTKAIKLKTVKETKRTKAQTDAHKLDVPDSKDGK